MAHFTNYGERQRDTPSLPQVPHPVSEEMQCDRLALKIVLLLLLHCSTYPVIYILHSDYPLLRNTVSSTNRNLLPNITGTDDKKKKICLSSFIASLASYSAQATKSRVPAHSFIFGSVPKLIQPQHMEDGEFYKKRNL